jgi:hypothetical protein
MCPGYRTGSLLIFYPALCLPYRETSIDFNEQTFHRAEAVAFLLCLKEMYQTYSDKLWGVTAVAQFAVKRVNLVTVERRFGSSGAAYSTLIPFPLIRAPALPTNGAYALVALYTLQAGWPISPNIEPMFRMMPCGLNLSSMARVNRVGFRYWF